MIRKNYSSPDSVTVEIGECGQFCKGSNHYLAPDVVFGDDGEAGTSFGEDDINWGGSF